MTLRRFLAALMVVAVAIGVCRTLAAAAVDADNDGLPDAWERGPGRQYGCSPQHADFLVYAVDRSSMPEKLEETIQKATAFYAALHVKNPDGRPGISLHVIRGPKVPDDGETYEALAARLMPPALRGKAHFHVFSDSPGGQTAGNASISGVAAYGWNSFVHELGHQLLLDHEARGYKVQSPLHHSLMNYAYMVAANPVDPVQFSDGWFAHLAMTEEDLDETLPFSIDELGFLGRAPYAFPLKAVGRDTQVDWNRNGVFGETHVRADINYDQGTYLGDRSNVEVSASAPVLAYHDKALYLAFAVDADRRLVVRRLLDKHRWGPRADTGVRAIRGDPSMVDYRDRLWTAAATDTGIAIRALEPSGDGAKVDASRSVTVSRPPRIVAAYPTLAVLDDQLYLFIEQGNGAVLYATYSGRRTTWSAFAPTGLHSRTPVGVAWHPLTREVVIVTTVDTPKRKDRLVSNARAVTDGALASTGRTDWVGGPNGPTSSSGRPTVLVNTSRDAGPGGRIYAYYRSSAAGAGQAYVSMQVADKTFHGGWLERSIYDIWTNTKDPPGAAFSPNGDITYCYRDAKSGMLKVSFAGSGIEPGKMGDFDELTFIRDHGLEESLARQRGPR